MFDTKCLFIGKGGVDDYFLSGAEACSDGAESCPDTTKQVNNKNRVSFISLSLSLYVSLFLWAFPYRSRELAGYFLSGAEA